MVPVVVSGMRLNGLSARSQMRKEMDEIDGRVRSVGREEQKQIRTRQ